MSKLVRSLALMLALAGASSLTLSVADAQEKGKDAKKGEKADPKMAEKDGHLGSIEVYKGKSGFRFRIKDADGKTLAMPTSNKHWDTRKEAEDALTHIKDILNKTKVIEVKDDMEKEKAK